MSDNLNAHLISQFVLKRFCNQRVGIKSKTGEVIGLEKPKKVAYIPHKTKNIQGAENTWGQTETKLYSAYKKLRAGTLLEDEFYSDIIKRLIAIHYVRSLAFYVLLNKFSKDALPEILESVAQDLGTPLTPAHVIYGAAKWRQTVDESTANMLIEHTEKVYEIVSKYGLEIGEAAPGLEFIIGDIPVLTLKDGRSGVLNQVRIDDCDAVGMPLSPKYVVALRSNPKSTKYISLGANEVAAANNKFINQSIERYFFRPSR